MNNSKDNLKTIIVLAILVAVFSVWNANLIEAKESNGNLSDEVNREILWLARVVYSETKKSNEQVLVAWVVRNRVETSYTGNSYEKVALARNQFSGLNVRDAQYLHNISRNYNSPGESWKSALDVAEAVYYSPEFLRPFSKSVRHFYSPKSVKFDPEWSANHKPVIVIRDSSNEERYIRFAFYDSIK